jgi:hypothetical protein
MVIEAVFEEIGVKEAVFKELDRCDAKPGAILASNTSTLDVNKIASVHRSARRTWSACTSSAPANVMKLLEVVRGAGNCQGRDGHRDGRGQEDQARRPWSPACATASSATA